MSHEVRPTVDPDGREVVFDAGSQLHLAQGRRAWLLELLDAIMATVELPDHREEDPRPRRERFYRQNVLDPGRWLRVVVDFKDVPGWIVTVLVQGQRPAGRRMMSVTIADINFDHHEYDERGDVLYVSVAEYEGPPARAVASTEGHNVEFDASGRVVGMTLVNVRWLLERDGEVTITWPTGHVRADDLAPALASAA